MFKCTSTNVSEVALPTKPDVKVPRFNVTITDEGGAVVQLSGGADSIVSKIAYGQEVSIELVEPSK